MSLTTLRPTRPFGPPLITPPPPPQPTHLQGLNRLAFFLALDSVDAVLSLIHSAVYLVMWYSFAVPRAVVWQMYAVTAATVYACTGMAYLLSQVGGGGMREEGGGE